MHNSEIRLHANCACDSPYVSTRRVQKQLLSFLKKTIIHHEKKSYIQNRALNRMEILKIIINNTKETQNTKLHFELHLLFNNP